MKKIIMPRRQRSDNELQDVSEHLIYEISMMNSMVQALALGLVGNGSPSSNAFLESFAIHFRCILEFFYQSNGPRPDDAIASDFFRNDEWEDLCPALSHVLEKAKIRAGKEIAHLTYARIVVKPAEKGWNLIEISNEIGSIIDIFKRNVDVSKLGKSWPRP